MILVIAVAVVATVVTAGAAAMAMAGTLSGASLGGVMAAGSAVLSGGVVAGAAAGTVLSSAAMVGAAVIGGAVGSIASQGVAIAMDMQSGFSWKQVGLGALGAGVTAGLGQAGMFSGLAEYGKYAPAAANAAAGNAITQGLAVATDLQDKFNWRAVATSAMAAPVAQSLGNAAGGFVSGMVSGSAGQMAGEFTQRFTAGVVSQRIRMAVYNKGKLDYAAIAADAFGQVVGQGLVDAMRQPTEAEQQAANRSLLNAMERQADPDSYTTPQAGSGLRLGTGGPGLRLDPATVAGWSDQVGDGIRNAAQALAASEALERTIKDQALAMANFKATAGQVWAQEDAEAAAQALAARPAEHARADAYHRELARQAEQAREAQLQAYIIAMQKMAGPRGGAMPAYNVPAATVEIPDYDAAGNVTGMTMTVAAAPHVAANPLASQLLGGTAGVLDTFASAANSTVRLLGNSAYQVVDILTLGVSHNSEFMQNVWAEQEAVGAGLYRMATQPRTVVGEAIEGVANRYAQAEGLRAQGDEVGAARINAGLASEVASGVLGLGQTVGGLGRLGASGLRRVGVQDWNFVVNDVPNPRGQGGAIGFGLERVGNAGIAIEEVTAPGANLAPNVRAYPDGSLRTSDGKFASVAGQPAPGTVNAANYAEFLRRNGVDVVGTELEVEGPLGVRKYDFGTRNPDGSIFGIEIKSGGAKPDLYQDFSDRFINEFGATGRGRIGGQTVKGSMTIYLPSGG